MLLIYANKQTRNVLRSSFALFVRYLPRTKRMQASVAQVRHLTLLIRANKSPELPMGIDISGHTFTHAFLLSSRLYCWYRIWTGSATPFTVLIIFITSLFIKSAGRRLVILRCLTTSRELKIKISSPNPEELYLKWYLTTARKMCQQKCPLHSGKDILFYFLIFIVSEILFFVISQSNTCTSTISPTLTASKGCLMNFSVIWLICTRPS